MTRLLRQWRGNSQRSQAIVEFSLIAPILIVLLFGIVDFGRLIYTYATLNQAVNEGARMAIRDSPLLPTNGDVQTSVKQHAVDVSLANPCPNGPVTTATPPANQGWIYITQKFEGDSLAFEPLLVRADGTVLENAPGGTAWATPGGSAGHRSSAGCSATNPAHEHAALQVTIRYNFVPITPLLRQVTANNLVISAAATYQTEY